MKDEEKEATFEESLVDLFEEKLSLGFKVLSRSTEEERLEFEVEPLASHEESFGKVLEEFVGSSYRPLYRKDGEKLTISITQIPRKKRKFRPLLHLGLIVATAITMTLAGYIYWADGIGESLMFAFALMSILGVHELGHAIVARRHRIDATLPFFVPAPPLIPFGTFGAIIFMDSPIPNRRSLLDVGMAGPIAGFLVALPILLVGLKISPIIEIPVLEPGGDVGFIEFGAPLIFLIIGKLMYLQVPAGHTIELHPLGVAGWAGLLVTMLNLLPMGQLDGGHIVRAIAPKHFKKIYYAVAVIFLAIGMHYWQGWIFWVVFISFMTRLDHPGPLDDVSGLDPRRKALAIVPILIFILCFMPTPATLTMP